MAAGEHRRLHCRPRSSGPGQPALPLAGVARPNEALSGDGPERSLPFAAWRESSTMTRFAFPDLTRAFRDGERFGDGTMRVIEVDPLVLPTGRIVACDPMRLLFSRQPA